MTGDEAEALDSQSDYGAAEDMDRRDREKMLEYRGKQRAFKSAVKAEVEKQLKRIGIEPKPYEPRGKMNDRVCQCGCGQTFQAREADVKRGWGKFSSKACAARYKDQMSGGRNREHYGY